MNAKVQTILLAVLVCLLGAAINTQGQASKSIATVGQLASDDHEQLSQIRNDVAALRLEVQSLQANGTGPSRDVANELQALQDKADQISASQEALIRRLHAKGILE
jgi:hypothetical protein